jgi:hypothetical protein
MSGKSKMGYILYDEYVTCISPLCVNYGVTRRLGQLYTFRACKEVTWRQFAKQTGVNAHEGKQKQHRGKTASQIFKRKK